MRIPNHSLMMKIISLIVLVSCSVAMQASDQLLKLRDFYYSQDYFECREIYQPDDNSIHQVVLIRHAEPDLEHEGWRNRQEATEYIQRYDAASIKPFNVKPVCADQIEIEKIYHSNLVRSRETARLTFGDDVNYIEKTMFREVERQILPFPNIKLPGGFWSAASRILWFFGANDDSVETAREAENRVIEATAFLEERAEEETTVVLVAHGLLNELLIRQFEKEGWHEVYDGGNEFLSVRIVARMNPEL